MSFLLTLLDFMLPLKSSSPFGVEDEVLESSMGSNEMMVINPASGMPMMCGVGGIDMRGNVWGQSHSLGDESFYSSVDSSSDLFDGSSMFDSTSTFDACSMFD